MQLRPMISRIVGPYIAMAAAWVGGQQLDLPPELVADLESAMTTATVLALYGVTHKALDALGINPLDDAAGSGS